MSKPGPKDCTLSSLEQFSEVLIHGAERRAKELTGSMPTTSQELDYHQDSSHFLSKAGQLVPAMAPLYQIHFQTPAKSSRLLRKGF